MIRDGQQEAASDPIKPDVASVVRREIYAYPEATAFKEDLSEHDTSCSCLCHGRETKNCPATSRRKVRN